MVQSAALTLTLVNIQYLVTLLCTMYIEGITKEFKSYTFHLTGVSLVSL